jgi:hypothetical protein
MLVKRFGLGLFVAVSLVLSACTTLQGLSNPSVIEGSGTLATETRALSGFTEIVLAGSGDVDVVVGEPEGVVIEAEDNLLPLLTTEVSGGRLVIGTKAYTRLAATLPIHYTVTLKHLEAIQITGSGKVTIPQVMADWLKFELSGSGHLTARGSVDELHEVLSGSGNIDTADLQATAARVDLPGSGNIAVWVTQSLNVTLDGSGSVTYYGHPDQFEQDIHGSGEVHGLGDK